MHYVCFLNKIMIESLMNLNNRRHLRINEINMSLNFNTHPKTPSNKVEN